MPRRTATRTVRAAALAVTIVVGAAAPASAHVTVNPKAADPGSYAKLTFRVPTERDDASTTKVEIDIPTDHPIANVSVQPTPGWTYTVEKANLTTPISTDDGTLATATSKVTWTADATSAIKPGEFGEFNISAGPLPKDASNVTFKALQTYSDGEVVRWIDVAAPGARAEHPAPTLTLTAAPGAATATSTSTAPTDAASEDDLAAVRALAIAGIALAAVALVLVIVRLRAARSTTS